MSRPWTRRSAIAGMGAAVAAASAASAASAARAAQAPQPAPSAIQRLDPALDALINADAPITRVMEGFRLSEGPCWVGGADGYLLVSDVPGNVIRRWSARDGQSDFLAPSGIGVPSVMIREPGSNGLILARGAVVMADGGNRVLARLDLRTRTKRVIASHFEGRRLNSPNDLVAHRDGSIYFTDPANGLTGRLESPWRELDFTGVMRLAPDGTVTAVDRTLALPNGIALSPDGRTLYASDWGVGWFAYSLDPAGRATDKRPFAPGVVTAAGGPAADGFKVDSTGHVWASSRDGLSIFDPSGKRIGVIGPGRVSNCEFGADGYLYICSGPEVVRVRTRARKIRL